MQRKGSNVLICFDESEPITLDYRTVLDNGLRKDDKIDEKIFEQLISESIFLKTKDSAFRLLGRRHHSTSELRIKLSKKKYPKEIIKKVLSELTSQTLLNDEQFAIDYMEERSLKKKIGLNKLKAELFKKGIERKIVENVLQNIDADLSFEQALELARRKKIAFLRKEKDKRKLKSKIFSFLSSRGYEAGMILRVLKEIEPDEDEVPFDD